MKSYTTLALTLAVITVVLAGCSSATPKSAAPPTVDVTGTWTGNLQYGAQFFQTTFRLQQSGARVTGSGTARLTQGAPDFTVDGTVSGNEFTYHRSGGTGIGSLIVNGDEMTGSEASGLPLRLRRQGSAISPKP